LAYGLDNYFDKVIDHIWWKFQYYTVRRSVHW